MLQRSNDEALLLWREGGRAREREGGREGERGREREREGERGRARERVRN